MSCRITRAGALVALVLSASCTDSTGRGPVPASLRLAEAEPVVEMGVRKRLEVTVLDDRGRAITGVPVRFVSSRPELVQVDSLTGVMIAVAPGTAEIIVQAHSLRARVPITVQVPGGTEVDSFALEPDGGGAVLLDTWSLPAKSLRFHAANAQGTSLCGLVPLTLESDTMVFVARYAPRGADPCLISLFPRGNGVRWLRARAGDAVDSVRVTVRGMGFRWVLSTPPDVPHAAGDGVRYSLFVVGEDGRRVAGVPVRFAHVGTDQSAEVVVKTDADGFARVAWTLPTRPRVNWRETWIESYREESTENPFHAEISATLPNGIRIEHSADVAVFARPGSHIAVVARRTGEYTNYWQWGESVYESETNSESFTFYRTLSGDSVVLRRFLIFGETLAAYVADRYGNPTGQPLTMAALEGATPSMQPHGHQETSTVTRITGFGFGDTFVQTTSTSSMPGGVVWTTNLSAPFPRVRLTFSAAGIPSRTVTVVGVDSIR